MGEEPRVTEAVYFSSLGVSTGEVAGSFPLEFPPEFPPVLVPPELFPPDEEVFPPDEAFPAGC